LEHVQIVHTHEKVFDIVRGTEVGSKTLLKKGEKSAKEDNADTSLGKKAG